MDHITCLVIADAPFFHTPSQRPQPVILIARRQRLLRREGKKVLMSIRGEQVQTLQHRLHPIPYALTGEVTSFATYLMPWPSNANHLLESIVWTATYPQHLITFGGPASTTCKHREPLT